MTGDKGLKRLAREEMIGGSRKEAEVSAIERGKSEEREGERERDCSQALDRGREGCQRYREYIQERRRRRER